jgi:uncharacterized protein (DUF2141 family)
MKNLLITSIMLMALNAHSQNKVEVVVKNVKGATGNVRVGVFKDDKTFLKDAWMGKIVKAEKGEVKVLFENVPVGTYAISIIHDENENGELDSNFFGMPKEGFGFSNDAMGTFGPPDFTKASFKVTGEALNMVISLRYL